MNVYRDIAEPRRTGLSWSDTWIAPDRGLIMCWEMGRTLALREPETAQKCLLGELPALGWKGGFDRTLKKLERFGGLAYLAQWQGLRGENLDIDLTKERTITCTKTGMIVTYTPDQSKYANQKPDTEDNGETLNGGPASGIPEQSLFS